MYLVRLKSEGSKSLGKPADSPTEALESALAAHGLDTVTHATLFRCDPDGGSREPVRSWDGPGAPSAEALERAIVQAELPTDVPDIPNPVADALEGSGASTEQEGEE